MAQLLVSNGERVATIAAADKGGPPMGADDDLALLDLDGIPDDVAEYARNRLGETEETRTKLLAELEDMIYGNRNDNDPTRVPNFHQFPPDFIFNFFFFQ